MAASFNFNEFTCLSIVGARMTRYTKDGCKQAKLKITADGEAVMFGAETFKLTSYTMIFRGQGSGVLQAMDVDDRRALSIASKAAVLDLVAKNQKARDTWAKGLEQLCHPTDAQSYRDKRMAYINSVKQKSSLAKKTEAEPEKNASQSPSPVSEQPSQVAGQSPAPLPALEEFRPLDPEESSDEEEERPAKSQPRKESSDMAKPESGALESSFSFDQQQGEPEQLYFDFVQDGSLDTNTLLYDSMKLRRSLGDANKITKVKRMDREIVAEFTVDSVKGREFLIFLPNCKTCKIIGKVSFSGAELRYSRAGTKESYVFPLDSDTIVVAGKEVERFVKKVPKECCLSLIRRDDAIHLAARRMSLRDMWVSGLTYLTDTDPRKSRVVRKDILSGNAKKYGICPKELERRASEDYRLENISLGKRGHLMKKKLGKGLRGLGAGLSKSLLGIELEKASKDIFKVKKNYLTAETEIKKAELETIRHLMISYSIPPEFRKEMFQVFMQTKNSRFAGKSYKIPSKKMKMAPEKLAAYEVALSQGKVIVEMETFAYSVDKKTKKKSKKRTN